MSTLVPVHRLAGDTRIDESAIGVLVENASDTFRPFRRLAGLHHVGLSAFEYDIAVRRTLRLSGNDFDRVVTASWWCEQVLREAGLRNIATVHYGVDHRLFSPARATRGRFHNRFVVFSGGSFSLQKAQDVVIKAVRILANRHADVFLLAAWDTSMFHRSKSMKASPNLPPVFDGRYANGPDMLQKWIRECDFDPNRIEFVSPMAHDGMATVYGNSDVGLFPNRCEGDTNLLMMEYMACGKPVIATNFSGHRDVLTASNSHRLQSLRISPYQRYGDTVGLWCEPDVEEVVAALENAYENRDHLKTLGARAAADLQQWTWERTGLQLLAQLQNHGLAENPEC